MTFSTSMRQMLVWLMVFGVCAGLSTRLTAGADHHVVFTHSHEHDGDHHHHPHELPAGDHDSERCPDSSHEHQHVVCCSPVVLGLERAECRLFAGFPGSHVALRNGDEAPPEGPYPELDTPPLI